MFKSFVLLLIVCHSVFSWEILYQELEDLAGSCFPQDSCSIHRKDEDDHLWSNYSCECGIHCFQYDTCCADSPYYAFVFNKQSGHFPYTGRPSHGRSVDSPYTGRSPRGRSIDSPYTGRSPHGRSIDSPYTGRSPHGRSIDSPYTGTSPHGRLPNIRSPHGRSVDSPYTGRPLHIRSADFSYTGSVPHVKTADFAYTGRSSYVKSADSMNSGRQLHAKSQQGATCQKLPGMAHAVVAVSECSDRWRYDYHIQNKCQNAETEMDPIGMIPVTNVVTRVTYKNYFCALCNCDASNVLFWGISLQLNNRETALGISNITEDDLLKSILYDNDEESWGVNVNGLFYNVKLQTQLPVSFKKLVKKCYPNTVSQCDPSLHPSHELQLKCLSYYAPIKLRTDTQFVKFRNIHCALCNNVNVPASDVSICKLDVDVRKAKPPFSFALLLDINTRDGDLVGKVRRCDDSQTWDPFFKKCRSLVCALPGYVVRGDQCVLS